jgi:DeoR/GlpR family transcriptional regulator of sugar metabolism
VLGSAEKIGAVSRFPVLSLDEITGVVTDPEDDDPLIAQLRTA